MLKPYTKGGLRLCLCALLLTTSSVFGRIDLNAPKIFDGPLPGATVFTETFENIGASSSVFSDLSWTGDEGIFFIATDAKTDGTINGRALTVRDGQMVATDISGGIADLTITTQGEVGSGTGTLDIIVNGISVGTVPYNATVQTTTISAINLEGFFDLQIDFPGTDNIKIDDLSWGCYQLPPALFFSQYVETDEGIQPKGVEIWNNTGSTIDFSVDNLVIEKGTNGGTPSSDFTLSSGTLESGKVIVIGSDEIGTYLEATFGIGAIQYQLKAFTFNGDDALVLKLDGEITDMIGTGGTDPGSEWAGSGVSTKNQNISLLSVIEGGSPAGFTDPSERFSTTSTAPSDNGGLQGFGLAPNEASYVLAPSIAAAVQCADFDVLVSIVNGGDLNTVETYLTFDPSLVQVESVTAPGGGALPDLSTLSQVVLPVAFDNMAGTITYAASSPALLTDNFDLMKITFSAVAGTGTSTVDVVLTGSPISRIATTGLVGGVFVAADLDVTAYSEGITLTPDLELPFFACVSGPNEEADLGTCIYTVQGLQYDPVGAEDNCGIASIINDYNNTSTLAGEPLTDGTTITWTVTDVNGNFGQCTFTMTVEDAQNTVAVCQSITVQLDANGMASITPGDIDDGSTDNCGVANLSLDVSDFTCANLGANTVTLTVTDAAGNQDQCTALVTVEDNVVPIASCQNITVQLDASGNATITGSDIDNGSSDACGVSLSVSPSTFDCSNIGANTVTLTVIDSNGNTSTCTAIATVEDNVAPTAICQNITVQLDASGNVLIAASEINNGSNDACGIANVEISQTSFSCTDVGSNTVVLTVTDNNGNASTCSALVLIEDNIDPIAFCDNFLVELDANGSATITGNDLDDGSSDNCGISSLTLSQSTFGCADVGIVNVVFTATDFNGNQSTCSAIVIVEDNIDPTAVCQDITVQLDDFDNATITGNDIDNGSSDACGLSSLAVSKSTFTCADVGPNTVTLTVTDANLNTASCTAIVTVEDNVDPTAVCQDAVVFLDANGNGTITVVDVNNGSADACGIASVSLSVTSFDCSNLGANPVTLTVTDINGNSNTCTANVTVQDNIAPLAPALNTVTAECTTTLTAPTTTDNCAGTVTGTTADPLTYTGEGTYTVSWNFDDGNGNDIDVTQTVIIDDVTDPVSLTLTDVTAECTATLTAPTSTDNCAGTVTGTTTDPLTYTGEGTYTVSWNFDDGNGNTIDVLQTVIIDDTTVPVVTCPSDIAVGNDVDLCGALVSFAATATDNCGGSPSISYSQNPGTNFPVGSTTVIVTADDGNGNTETCSFSVTVNDTQNPAIACASDATVSVNQTNDTYLVSNGDFDTTVSDNCSGVTVEHNAAVVLGSTGPNSQSLDGWEFPIGTTVIEFTATDASSNTSVCSVSITVDATLISGNLTLNSACLPLDMTVTVYEAGTPNLNPVLVANYTNVIIDASGDFSLNASGLIPGIYDVYLKPENYLTKRVVNVSIGASPSGITATAFLPGDISNVEDDIINGTDLSTIIFAYNTTIADAGYDANADLNCDGFVDALDLSLLIFSFLAEGDSPTAL